MSTCVPAVNMSIANPIALSTGSGWVATSMTPKPVRPSTKPARSSPITTGISPRRPNASSGPARPASTSTVSCANIGEIMPRTPALVSIVAATRSYETWVGRQVPLVRADIAFKHEQMALAAFPFLRATFYRWVQQWAVCCPDLATTPKVLAVGDLHTENFGTWRDDEGRLIWGINDFDEAFPLGYTIDLVRLATSARMAIDAGTLQITPREACAAILEGYRDGINGDGRPFVLEEDHPVLRAEATSELRDPVTFWQRMIALPTMRRPPSARSSCCARSFVTRRLHDSSHAAPVSGASVTPGSSQSRSTPAVCRP